MGGTVSDAFGGGIIGGILDPAGGIAGAAGVGSPGEALGKSGGPTGLSPAQEALIGEQIRLGQEAAGRDAIRFAQQTEDIAGVREGIPALQTGLFGGAQQLAGIEQQLAQQGGLRRAQEEAILSSQLFAPGAIAGGAQQAALTGRAGAAQLAALAPQFQGLAPALPPQAQQQALSPGLRNLFLGQRGETGLPPGAEQAFTRGAPGFQLDPGLLGGATTRPVLGPQGPVGFAPGLPQPPISPARTITSPEQGTVGALEQRQVGRQRAGRAAEIVDRTARQRLEQIAAGQDIPRLSSDPQTREEALARLSPAQGLGGFTPGQADPLGRQPGQLFPTQPSVPGAGFPAGGGTSPFATTQPVPSPTPFQAGTPQVGQVGQIGEAVTGLAGQTGQELAGIRGGVLGALGQVAQGQLPQAVSNLFAAPSARERGALEAQFQAARSRVLGGAAGAGGALSRNLAALEAQRAFGVAGLTERQGTAERQFAQNLFGVATQAGLGAPGQQAGLLGQAGGLFGTAEQQRQAGLTGATQALDVALGRDLQAQQLAQQGQLQSTALAQSLAQQFGRGADQFLLARPGVLGQLAAQQQQIATAPGIPASLLAGQQIPSAQGFLGPALQSLTQQQIASQQAAAQQQAGFGQLLGTAGIGALALFT